MTSTLQPQADRVLVCGGRDFADPALLYATLNKLAKVRYIDCIIHGDAKGADRMAGYWARKKGITEHKEPADWTDLSYPDAIIKVRRDGTQYDARAGLRRNSLMLEKHRPTIVIGFRGGTGTADMLAKCKAAGCLVLEIR